MVFVVVVQSAKEQPGIINLMNMCCRKPQREIFSISSPSFLGQLCNSPFFWHGTNLEAINRLEHLGKFTAEGGKLVIAISFK